VIARLVPVLLLAVLVLCTPATAADRPTKKDVKAAYSAGDKVCSNLSLSALVGKSPWLVMAAGGATQYFTADPTDRDKLGLFANPWVWGTLAVLVLLVAFKDTILSAFSYLKMPLNALAEVFHTAGGAFGLLYLGTVAFGDPTATTDSATASLGSSLFAVDPDPSAVEQVGNFGLWLCMCVVHAAVWVVFNTVEVVILISPFPFVDAALKTIRTAIIAVIAGAAQIHPVLGLVVAAPVILLSFLLVPIALRFAVVGYVFTRDTLKRWFGAVPNDADPVRGFASWHLPGTRLYAYGTVDRGPAGLEFVTRRLFFVWTKRVPIPANVAVTSGVLTPALVTTSDGKHSTVLRFPPRYNGHEAAVSQRLGLGEVLDGSLRSSLGAAWKQFTGWLAGKKPAEGAA
jgi:hypothetical protein